MSCCKELFIISLLLVFFVTIIFISLFLQISMYVHHITYYLEQLDAVLKMPEVYLID